MEDLKLRVTVLCANARVREAYHAARGGAHCEDMLGHLLLCCQHYTLLGEVVRLPLSPTEKAALLSFLR